MLGSIVNKAFSSETKSTPAEQCSEPRRDKSGDHTRTTVQKGDPRRTVPGGKQHLPLKAGECRVATEKSDNEQEPVVGMRRKSLRQYGHEQANDETARYIDNERGERESSTEMRIDNVSDAESRRAARGGAQHDHEIVRQQRRAP